MCATQPKFHMRMKNCKKHHALLFVHRFHAYVTLRQALPSRELFAKPAEEFASESVNIISLDERKAEFISRWTSSANQQQSKEISLRSLFSNLRFKDILCPPQYITLA